MNATQSEELSRIIASQYLIAGAPLSDEACLYYLSLIDDLPFDEVIQAIKTYARTNKTGRPPQPGHIRELIHPKTSEKEDSTEIAMSIVGAVSKHGHTNYERAKQSLREEAWEIVQAFGGWMTLCENLGASMDINTFIAQARDMASGIKKRPKTKEKDLLQIENKEVLSLLKMNQLPADE